MKQLLRKMEDSDFREKMKFSYSTYSTYSRDDPSANQVPLQSNKLLQCYYTDLYLGSAKQPVPRAKDVFRV